MLITSMTAFYINEVQTNMASKFPHNSFITQCYQLPLRPSHNNSRNKQLEKHFFPKSHLIVATGMS